MVFNIEVFDTILLPNLCKKSNHLECSAFAQLFLQKIA